MTIKIRHNQVRLTVVRSTSLAGKLGQVMFDLITIPQIHSRSIIPIHQQEFIRFTYIVQGFQQQQLLLPIDRHQLHPYIPDQLPIVIKENGKPCKAKSLCFTGNTVKKFITRPISDVSRFLELPTLKVWHQCIDPNFDGCRCNRVRASYVNIPEAIGSFSIADRIVDLPELLFNKYFIGCRHQPYLTMKIFLHMWQVGLLPFFRKNRRFSPKPLKKRKKTHRSCRDYGDHA